MYTFKGQCIPLLVILCTYADNRLCYKGRFSFLFSIFFSLFFFFLSKNEQMTIGQMPNKRLCFVGIRFTSGPKHVSVCARASVCVCDCSVKETETFSLLEL
jgi:hypothetical protein